MNQDVIYALEEIANCLNQTDYLGIVGTVISFLGFITTCIVIVFNYRTIKLTQTQIQKSIDIQLYDRYFTIIERIEKNDYSTSITEIALLFGEDIAAEVSELVNLNDEMDFNNREQQEYFKLLKDCSDPEIQEFYNLYLKMEQTPEKLFPAEEKRFDELFEKNGILTFTDEEGNEKTYDIGDIKENQKRLEQNFCSLNNKVLIALKCFMKGVLSIEGNGSQLTSDTCFKE